MNLRRLTLAKRIPVTNVDSSIIYNITNSEHTQKKLFKLGCVWSGGQDIIKHRFQYILITENYRMSYWSSDDSEESFDAYMYGDARDKKYKRINSNKL